MSKVRTSRQGLAPAVAFLFLALATFACAKAPPAQAVDPYAGGPVGGSGDGTCAIVGGAGGADGSGTVGAVPWLHVDGNQIKDPSGNPVILRGAALADLGETEVLEGGINRMIDRLTNQNDGQGCSSGWYTRVVRFAVSPMDGDARTPIQYQPGGTYYANVLRPAIDYARTKGLYVIIDWHYIDDTSMHRQTTTEFWTDIAPRFANDSHVLFELYNEPINSGSWSSLRVDMQAWYDIVRAAAPNNLILVGTPNWCQYVGDAAANPINGTNVVYVAHMYPEHFMQPMLRNQIISAAATHPVIITEWGFQQGTNSILDSTITAYGNPFKRFVEAEKLSWTGWCASRSWRPVMFNSDFSLLVGEGYLGGFVKDWLYQTRDTDQPVP